jgi:hypothetical protein
MIPLLPKAGINEAQLFAPPNSFARFKTFSYNRRNGT